METDPFASWYATRIVVDEERQKYIAESLEDDWKNSPVDLAFKPGDFEYFTINHTAGSNEEVQERQIAVDNVESWVDQLTKKPAHAPGIDLLIVRHKDLGRRDIKYRWLPFTPEKFINIFERLHLPKSYFHLRTTGGAQCGGATYHTYRDDYGNVTGIAFIIRPAHASVTEHGSSSAYALIWNALNCRTTGFFDGITKSDMDDLKGFLKSCSNLLSHPLTLPEIILHMIVMYLNEHLRIPSEEEFFVEERRTGLSRVQAPVAVQHDAIWNWSLKDFQDSTSRTNKFITTLSYIRRRFVFAMQLARRLEKIQDELQTYEFEKSETKGIVKNGAIERKERLQNRLGLLENYEHQTDCMRIRADNLNTVLYTVLSQIDIRKQSRIAESNLQIATAVRSDSIPMRTIAYVTLVFLPGAFVAAIFGMNLFVFDSETKSLIVAKDFWLYWAVTIPVTIFILLLWNYWVWVEKREGQGNRNEAQFPLQIPLEEMEIGAQTFRAHFKTHRSEL